MRQSVAILFTLATLSGCATDRPVAVIPIKLVDGNPVTSARIGDVSIDVVVDTGGLGGIAVSPDDLTRLDIELTDDVIERTDAAGNTFRSRTFIAPELTLGNKLFKDVRGFERLSATSGFAGGAPINVLGRGFLQEFTVIVDYGNAQIRLYSAAQSQRACGPPSATFIENPDQQMLLSVQTDGGEMLALMDTGATYSFVQSDFVDAQGLSVIDGAYTTKSLRVGDRELGPLEMVVLAIRGAPEIDALIGANFFSKLKVCFDYNRRTVSFPD